MIYLGIFAIAIALWMAYELWRAPLLRADRDDETTFTTVRPERGLKDLFKLFNKKTGNNDHSNNT
jgi:hypothetical protein